MRQLRKVGTLTASIALVVVSVTSDCLGQVPRPQAAPLPGVPVVIGVYDRKSGRLLGASLGHEPDRMGRLTRQGALTRVEFDFGDPTAAVYLDDGGEVVFADHTDFLGAGGQLWPLNSETDEAMSTGRAPGRRSV